LHRTRTDFGVHNTSCEKELLRITAFDTVPYHLFEFYYDGERFEIPDEDAFEEQICMKTFDGTSSVDTL